MKRVDLSAYGVPEQVAACMEVPDAGASLRLALALCMSCRAIGRLTCNGRIGCSCGL